VEEVEEEEVEGAIIYNTDIVYNHQYNVYMKQFDLLNPNMIER
jgi:hypothetical protein